MTLLKHIEPIDNFEQLGFSRKSAQGNFLAGDDPEKFAVIVHEPHVEEHRIDGPHVVACAFGTRSVQGGVVWYVGVNKNHSLNNSERGRRWGHYGLSKDSTGAKTRWKETDGKKITAKNHVKHVKGSANPYAVFALWCFCKFALSRDIWQHSTLPCAQLFHKDYDHTTHPATQLIYTSLGFAKTQLGHFARYDALSRPLNECFRQFLERMRAGLDAS